MMLLGIAFKMVQFFGEEFEKVYRWVDIQTTDQMLIETSF